MESTIQSGMDAKLYMLVSNFRLTKMENVLTKMLEDMLKSKAVDYIGELNKTDVMF